MISAYKWSGMAGSRYYQVVWWSPIMMCGLFQWGHVGLLYRARNHQRSHVWQSKSKCYIREAWNGSSFWHRGSIIASGIGQKNKTHPFVKWDTTWLLAVIFIPWFMSTVAPFILVLKLLLQSNLWHYSCYLTYHRSEYGNQQTMTIHCRLYHYYLFSIANWLLHFAMKKMR